MKFVSTLLTMALLISSVVFIPMPPVEADVAKAEVYIIHLSDVGSWWVNDPSDAVEGAIRAMNVTEENYENTNIPLVHPKSGKGPPFYSVDYEVVSDWGTYKTVVESVDEAIVVNTHGEILPVPLPYSKEGWAAQALFFCFSVRCFSLLWRREDNTH